MTEAEEMRGPGRGNRKWLQGDEGEAPGDDVGAQARMVMLAWVRCLSIALRTVEAIRGFSPES